MRILDVFGRAPFGEPVVNSTTRRPSRGHFVVAVVLVLVVVVIVLVVAVVLVRCSCCSGYRCCSLL